MNTIEGTVHEFSRLLISGIKKYIVGLIIKTSSESDSLEKEKVYLGKLNMILVQVCATGRRFLVWICIDLFCCCAESVGTKQC